MILNCEINVIWYLIASNVYTRVLKSMNNFHFMHAKAKFSD